jgi:chromate reductase
MSKKLIGIFTGSLRKDSFSKKIALHLGGLLRERFEVVCPEIGSLELYNQDLEVSPPQSWLELRAQVRRLDGILFVTPEYNRSIPPVLKNAIDIASRPQGEGAWSGKPGAIVGVSPGALGGVGAAHHLRQISTCVNILMLAQPEAYIGNVHTLLDEGGNVTNEKTKEFLQEFAEAFTKWTDKF